MTHFVTRLLCLTLILFSPLGIAGYEVGQKGMVASRSALASEAGRDMLAAGGNAIDAAVATGFALAVTYPSAGNLGGGGFLLIQHAENGQVSALDFRETAPAAAHRDMFLDGDGNVDRELSLSSLQSSGVPGTVAGLLEALEQYGSLPREQVLAPAIRLAREGFILTDDLAGQFASNLEAFRKDPAALALFSREGEPLQTGDLWQQPALADTLERIARQGQDGFYQGKTADLLVATMEAGGGLITHEDLQHYTPLWREPVKGAFRDYTVWSMPPPSSGGVLLIQMLNMLSPYSLADMGWGSADTLHLMIEAQRRAYADRAEHLGDPDFYDVPMLMLLSENYARERFSDVSLDQASRSDAIGAGVWPFESPETTHYSVVDAAGNAVSVTTTLNRSYGNRRAVAGAGFLLNNEMDDFSSKPDSPNVYGLLGREANEIQPGKRMLSSMTPTIVSKAGRPVLVTGSPGGSTIINTVLQVVLNVLEHDMGIEEAVSRPRIHHQWMPDIVRYEEGAISDEARAALEARGHRGLIGSRFSIGDANTVLVTEKGLEGMSDPRNEGGTAGL